MARLSTRITTINGGGDDGWGVFLKARRMIAQGTPVTELTIGEHDIRTDPSILAAMDSAARAGHTGYAMVPGTDRLRDTVATRVTARTGVPTTRDNVIITPGGQAALFATHHATNDAGDTALMIDPYYATYPGTIRAVGARPGIIPTRSRDAFAPQRAEIDRAVETSRASGSTPRSLLVNSPNNPTGAIYGADTMQAIAQAACDHDLWLISDEVYDTQVWEGEHISPRQLPGMADRVLVIGSMSKSHAMTGSRVGWIVGPEQAIAHLIDLATNTTYGVPGYIQAAADFALNAGQQLEDDIGAPFRRRRAIAQKVLGAQQLVGSIPSQGAMYLMLDIRRTGLDGETFANRLLDTHHIAVMPGESFGASAAGHIRVAMTVEDTAFERALATLCEFAASVA
ncbi:MAG: aspartate aminotransferase [Pseudooceanicola sp.]|nr:aspartate aminotransferase [Pseudooceanicola sp.]